MPSDRERGPFRLQTKRESDGVNDEEKDRDTHREGLCLESFLTASWQDSDSCLASGALSIRNNLPHEYCSPAELFILLCAKLHAKQFQTLRKPEVQFWKRETSRVS